MNEKQGGYIYTLGVMASRSEMRKKEEKKIKFPL